MKLYLDLDATLGPLTNNKKLHQKCDDYINFLKLYKDLEDSDSKEIIKIVTENI